MTLRVHMFRALALGALACACSHNEGETALTNQASVASANEATTRARGGPSASPPNFTRAAGGTHDESGREAMETQEQADEPDDTPTWEVRIEDGMALVPEGNVFAGSLPGTPHRDPFAEADGVERMVPAFWIDVNLAGEDSPMVHVTPAQAEAYCEEQDKRLCHELEWERACEGANRDEYAGGPEYDPERASSYGVRAMGSRGEWVFSESQRPGTDAPSSVFRGAGTDHEDTLRRCAGRRWSSVETQSRHLSFRCCRSAEGASAALVAYPEVNRDAPRFAPRNWDDAEIQQVLQAVPEVAEYAPQFESVPSDAELATLGERGIEVLAGWELAPPAMRWSPVSGDELVVIHGRLSAASESEPQPILVALYVMPDGTYRHARSLIVEPTTRPLLVAFTPPERQMIKWSTNWGMLGESGVLELAEDNTIALEVR